MPLYIKSEALFSFWGWSPHWVLIEINLKERVGGIFWKVGSKSIKQEFDANSYAIYEMVELGAV